MTTITEINFQSESSQSGNEFEDAVALELSEIYDLEQDEFHRKLVLHDVGIELDYFVVTEEGVEAGEAKGGRPNGKKRPGAKRTDNVKKAICNGALLHQLYPDLKYVVYFSAPPKENSRSDIMLQVALEAGFISEIRYLNIYTFN
jgi:hypothetical protein